MSGLLERIEELEGHYAEALAESTGIDASKIDTVLRLFRADLLVILRENELPREEGDGPRITESDDGKWRIDLK